MIQVWLNVLEMKFTNRIHQLVGDIVQVAPPLLTENSVSDTNVCD